MEFGRPKSKTGTRLVPVRPEEPVRPERSRGQRDGKGPEVEDVIAEIETALETFTLSNVSENRTLDAATISTADLADVVGTLIQDLKTILLP